MIRTKTLLFLLALMAAMAGCGSKEKPKLPAKAVLSNTTRPGSADFLVGDSFKLAVTGTPGERVVGSVMFDGKSAGVKGYGSTDTGGTLIITGVMKDEHVGSWHEEWSVGGVNAPPLDFAVKRQP
jgi:hypothetical protein